MNETQLDLQKRLDKKVSRLSKLLDSTVIIDDELNEELSTLYEDILILEFAINYGRPSNNR